MTEEVPDCRIYSMLTSLINRIAGLTKPKAQFDPATLPWTDRPDFQQRLADKRAAGEISADEAAMLLQWDRDGFVVLPKIIEDNLIDALWRDEARAWQERPVCKMESEGTGVTMLSESKPKQELTHHHYRIMDFHNLSQAGAHIMMHPKIVRTLELLFGEQICAMQSLLFEYGSEQHKHQDFAYVHAQIPSHLIGSWVACEEAGPENGSLVYFPGSHKIPMFDFGDGNVLYTKHDPAKHDEFERHLDTECNRLGCEPKTLRAQKGDVLLWHGALVHGGGTTEDRNRTRRTFVCHYSTQRAYVKDRRSWDDEPKFINLNGGRYHAWQFAGHEEGRYFFDSLKTQL